MNDAPRGPWYLLTGLLAGLVLGLFYAWALAPADYANVSPDTLQARYKEHYRAMIALAYLADGNLERAQARLALLGDPNPIEALSAQAQRALAEEAPEEEAYALGLLAAALGGAPQPQAPAPSLTATRLPAVSLSPTPSASPTSGQPLTSPTVTLVPSKTPSPTNTPPPQATFTPLPTRTPTPTPGAPFILDERSLVCDPAWSRPLLRVDVRDAARRPVPGVPVTVSWAGGEEIFYTGLKPDLGLGIADFEMTPGLTYTLVVGQGGQVISDLQAVECEAEEGGRYWGSWSLIFVQP